MRLMPSVLCLLLASGLLAGCGGPGSGGGAGSANDVVVFIADGRSTGVLELFASEANGANLRVISGPLVAFADVSGFAWSPDRSLVAFVADRDTDGQSELYLVDMLGNGPTKISGPLIAAGDVLNDIAWSDDGLHVAYRADANVVIKMELFVVTLGNPALRVSSPTMNDNGGVSSFAWQPGGTQLAHLTDNAGTGAFRVNLVNANGAGAVQINSAGPQDSYTWSPDGSRLAFRADSLNNGRFGLHTINPTGGGLLEVSNLLAAANNLASVQSYDWRNDGVKLAFVADRDVDERYEVWSVDALGTALLKIASAPAGTDVLDLAYSPGAFLVAYRRGDGGTFIPELHVVFDNATAETTLVEDDGVLGVTSYDWSPDGNRIAYLADHNVNNAADLFNVVVLGGPLVIDPMTSLGAGETVFGFDWAPDSSRLLVVSDDDAPAFGIRDIFVAIVNGSTTRITTNTNAGNDVEQFGWSSDGSTSLWIDGLTLVDPMHVFAASPTGASLTNLSLPLDPPLTDVTQFQAR